MKRHELIENCGIKDLKSKGGVYCISVDYDEEGKREICRLVMGHQMPNSEMRATVIDVLIKDASEMARGWKNEIV